MKKNKDYLWLPYTNKIATNKNSVHFHYKGGDLKINYDNIHSIMFYGSVCPLEQGFLENCVKRKVSIVIHRRNMHRAVVITPNVTTGKEDILTKQITFRINKKKKAYIARKLIKAKFNSMKWLINEPAYSLKGLTDIKDIVNVEAWHSKNYWEKYYKTLGFYNTTRRKKDSENLIGATLDAVSKFVSSIILRWIHYHNLSPYHGFIHTPTEYPSLVYDLIEPYRGYLDKVVFETFKHHNFNSKNTKNIQAISYTIENVKEFLYQEVYVHTTRQVVTFHELLHGIVLALVSYLKGNTRFIVPEPGNKIGGRPVNAGYKLYGRNAGITNFWPKTKKTIENFCSMQDL
ncbi:MAG: hypothetical protein KatS3mg085_229 [Candidatus Dojkabacteria bacterium]|nr:MAG: hypothetical protein KatS3mg085_229 [Candidatus Dojkabacteria bacterium]